MFSAQGRDEDSDELTYSWSQVSGPTVTFQDANTAQVTITLPEVSISEVVTLEVTVFDGNLIGIKTTSFIVSNVIEVVTESAQNKDGSGGEIRFGSLLLFVIVYYRCCKLIR